MKTRKWWIAAICLPLVMLAALLCMPGKSVSMSAHLEERLGVNLPVDVQIEYEDDHGGFHGDGTLTATVVFSSPEEVQSFSDTLTGPWENLPVNKPGLWGAVTSEWKEFPQPEQGVWFYRDRYYEKYGETCPFNPYLQNCTFAVMDTEKGVLYVLETDF